MTEARSASILRFDALDREGRIVSKLLTCSVFCALIAALAPAADRQADPGTQSWTESPYRNFQPVQAILGSRVLVSDEAKDPAFITELARELKTLQGQLHDREDWRSPLSDGDPLHVYIARKEAGGVHRLSSRSRERGRLVGASIQIDATGMSQDEIVREVGRLYALATLTAYGAPDGSFLTAAAAAYLAAGVRPELDREEALAAAAAPALDLTSRPDTLGRLYVEEFALSAGGAAALRGVWEKSAESGEEVLPLLLKAYEESTGEKGDALLMRFAARLYSSVEPEAAPSRIGLLDLLNGGLDATVPASFSIRHRSYLATLDAPAALRVSWPEEGAAAAAIVRYRDAALSPDVVSFAGGEEKTIPLAGVARLDWLIAGSPGGGSGARAPVSFEGLSGFPFSGLVAHVSARDDGPRVWWTTVMHQGLAGWAIFREEVLPDGRVARTGPEILPASDRGNEPLQYVFVDPGASAGTFYRYTVWAVTQDGTLARAFAATLRTAD